MAEGSRNSLERVTTSITNAAGEFEDWGVFDTFSGGEADSEETRHRAGGGGVEKPLGGSKTVGNVTITRLLELERDWGRLKDLMNRQGSARIIAVRQRLDVDYNAFGDPMTYTGIVKTVTPPDSDSTDDDAAMIEIEFTPASSIT
jgi:hypothetical protein